MGLAGNEDEKYMRMALAEAQKAYDMGEIPIGAVLVDESGEKLFLGHNLREINHDATAHAEMEVIRKACSELGHWRLTGMTLYVTIEPCPMCAGALVNSRVDRLVYGSVDSRAGAVESVFNVVNNSQLNHRMEVRAGILEDDCRGIMRSFFKMRRQQNKELKRLLREQENVSTETSEDKTQNKNGAT